MSAELPRKKVLCGVFPKIRNLLRNTLERNEVTGISVNGNVRRRAFSTRNNRHPIPASTLALLSALVVVAEQQSSTNYYRNHMLIRIAFLSVYHIINISRKLHNEENEKLPAQADSNRIHMKGICFISSEFSIQCFGAELAAACSKCFWKYFCSAHDLA